MTDLARIQRQYREWLAGLLQILNHEQQQLSQSMTPAVHALQQVKAYLQAGRQLTADETHLFVETFFRQQGEPEPPSIWPETLWQALSSVTDQTQVAWHDLQLELTSEGLHYAGDIAGMGVYACRQCGDEQHVHHPVPLLNCACGHLSFVRRGLPV